MKHSFKDTFGPMVDKRDLTLYKFGVTIGLKPNQMGQFYKYFNGLAHPASTMLHRCCRVLDARLELTEAELGNIGRYILNREQAALETLSAGEESTDES